MGKPMNETGDSFHLNRFISAQGPIYARVRQELQAGKKRSHWMWFVFPQLKGLGRSSTSKRYGIQGLDEARAYVEHPRLGPRLRECVEDLLVHRGRTPEAIFGFPDCLKFRSCLTLFARAVPGEPIFREALAAFFEGAEDPATLELLGLDAASE